MNYNFISMLYDAKERQCLISIGILDISHYVICIPIEINYNFVIVKCDNGYRFDGYKLIRTDDIIDVRYDRLEKFMNTVYETEGLLKNENFHSPVHGHEWHHVMQQIKQYSPIIYIAYRHGNVLKKVKGTVEAIQKNQFIFSRLYLDLEHIQPIPIQYENICCVSFGSYFCRIISDYMKKQMQKR